MTVEGVMSNFLKRKVEPVNFLKRKVEPGPVAELKYLWIFRYVLPEKPMTPSALMVTGLRVEGDTLLRHGKRVPTVSLREALRDFLDWLREIAGRSWREEAGPAGVQWSQV
ncbi:hypothetical protein BaRGS_00019292 [Batillaria attramentaria]|uniref:Uncharacterized protein n=1 Tax=Batillaria attramentaria TaxID=370345 RepID=A0ABD0KRE9_9CAEN